MSIQTLKDQHYRVIGFIETRPDGSQLIKDAQRHGLGYYDPRQNQTKNQRYHFVSHCNLLTTLLSWS